MRIDASSDPNRGRINQKFVESLTDKDIDRLTADDPDWKVDLDWSKAKLVVPRAKLSIHLRVDADTLEWFRSQGSGYLTRMNAVLKSYYLAHHRDA